MLIKLTLLFANQSIRMKLISINMLVSTLAIMIMTVALLLGNIQEIEQGLYEELNLVGNIIGKRSSAAIVYEQYDKLEKDLGDLKEMNHVVCGCIYNLNKEIISSYEKTGSNDKCPSAFEEDVLLNKVDGDARIKISNPIISNNETIGYIYINATLDKLDKKIKGLISNAFFTVIIAIIITYFVSSRLLKQFIIYPLRGLRRSIVKVSKGKYSSYSKEVYNDEIGELTRGFNSMIEAIHDRDSKLSGLNDSLEETVTSRTKDLEFTVSRLQIANKKNKEWIQNIGHEIRTPIQSITSLFNLMEIILDKTSFVEEKKEKISDIVSRIDKSCNRIKLLIDDLLDFGKLESGKLRMEFGKHNIEAIIKDAVLELSILFQEESIEAIHENEAGIELCCDRNRIIQVLTNVMSNAIKFSDKNSKIEISTKESSVTGLSGKEMAAIEIAISDQGIGIPEGEIESIFDTFVQSSATQNGTGGTGLGLAISREIIVAHEGKISAENNKDAGTTFFILIPINLPNGG